ncbi:MAG: CvpA family protein [Spirochaetales bacterium]|nr:CvpA family protein [Spirochaetales bacterium]MBO4716475.1 CvpA family protein [Spirochaetales bacterium]MBR5098579.1 CvpA family protein [Spirochaetales bacterium]
MKYLTTLDYILFIIFMIGGIWGAIKGFLDEISSKFGYVLGFILALMYTHLLSPVFVDNLGFPLWFASFTAYFIIFVAGYLIMKGFGAILSNIVDTANLSVVDNLLGFFLGLLEAFFLFAAFEYILGYQNLFNLKKLFDESLFSRKLIQPFAELCVSTIKNIF